jgi:hypothetical protein
MSKNFYDYYRILGKVNVDHKKLDEYGTDIYINVILDNINSIFKGNGFESVTLPKKYGGAHRTLKGKIFYLFNEIEKIAKEWDVYLVLVWEKDKIFIEVRQKIERLNVNPNDSNKIFKMLKKVMEDKNE